MTSLALSLSFSLSLYLSILLISTFKLTLSNYSFSHTHTRNDKRISLVKQTKENITNGEMIALSQSLRLIAGRFRHCRWFRQFCRVEKRAEDIRRRGSRKLRPSKRNQDIRHTHTHTRARTHTHTHALAHTPSEETRVVTTGIDRLRKRRFELDKQDLPCFDSGKSTETTLTSNTYTHNTYTHMQKEEEKESETDFPRFWVRQHN